MLPTEMKSPARAAERSRRRSRRTAGVSVVEMLVALGIFGVVVAGLATYVANFNQFRNNMSLVSTRDAISRRLQQQIQAFDNIQASAKDSSFIGNRKLLACLDVGNEPCDVTSAEKQVEFRFLVNQGAAGRRALAGPAFGETTPVKYNKNGGDNCQGTDQGCGTFEAHAYFWAVCQNGAPTCPQASTVFVRYQVRSNAKGVFTTNVPHSPPEPLFSDKKTSYAVSFPVFRGLMKDQMCPDYAQQAGYDSSGRVLCKCLLGYEPTGSDANGILCERSEQCKNGEVLAGLLVDGRPDCRKPKVQCRNIQFGKTVDGSPRCPAGGWLRDINLGTCRTGPKTKKASNREIACDTNAGQCCWYEIP